MTAPSRRLPVVATLARREVRRGGEGAGGPVRAVAPVPTV